MNINGHMEGTLGYSNMEVIEFIRSSKHWTTLVAIIAGGILFSVGTLILFLTIKKKIILSLIIFGAIFTIAGGAIFVKSVIDYCIKPKYLFFKATTNDICWGEGKKKECVKYSNIQRIDFYIGGTDMDAIYFFDTGGNKKRYINNRFLSEEQLIAIYEYVSRVYEGEVLFNQ